MAKTLKMMYSVEDSSIEWLMLCCGFKLFVNRPHLLLFVSLSDELSAHWGISDHRM